MTISTYNLETDENGAYQITEMVLKSINESKVKGIRESVPRTMRKSFETFAGVQGTPVYEAFKAGSLYYHRYLMVKP